MKQFRTLGAILILLMLAQGLTAPAAVWASDIRLLNADCTGWSFDLVNLTGGSLTRIWELRLDQVLIDSQTVVLPPYGSQTFAGLWNPAAVVNGQEHTATLDIPQDNLHVESSFGPCAAPAIQLVKQVNSEDANEAPGPFILVGQTVTWNFVVTNLGNAPLTDISVSDDVLGEVCTIAELAAGSTETCSISGTATAGPHVNTGTVEGYFGDTSVSDADLAHYFGAAPAIDIEKWTNGEDADTPTGPALTVGDTVIWTYHITNVGNVTLNYIAVNDDQLGGICTIASLAPGATTICTQQGAATEGQYSNLGTVTAMWGSISVSDSDLSHYLGILPPPVPSILSLTPDLATNQLPVDTNHVFTATVSDQYGNPVADVTVSFATDFGHFAGNTQYIEMTTNANGQAAVTITSLVTGTAHLRAWLDENGDDTYNEGELTDEPSIKVWQGEGPTGLTLAKTATISWDVVYSWSLNKTVTPTNVSLPMGELTPLAYAIEVIRSAVQETVIVQGQISAQNNGISPAHIVSVVDAIEYRLPDQNIWVEWMRSQVDGASWIPVGGVGVWDYAINLTVIPGATYRNVAYVTLANGSGGQETLVYRVDLNLPATPTSQVDECASVIDTPSVPTGFALVNSDYPAGGWQPCDSRTWTIRTTLVNVNAPDGSYTLINTASATALDSGSQVVGSAQVNIIVPLPQCQRLRQETYTVEPETNTPFHGVQFNWASDNNDNSGIKKGGSWGDWDVFAFMLTADQAASFTSMQVEGKAGSIVGSSQLTGCNFASLNGCGPVVHNNLAWSFMGAINNGNGTMTLKFKVKNNNTSSLNRVTFGLPAGIAPLWPLSTYTSELCMDGSFSSNGNKTLPDTLPSLPEMPRLVPIERPETTDPNMPIMVGQSFQIGYKRR